MAGAAAGPDMNVALRPEVAADAPWLERWLPAVAASVGYEQRGDSPAAMRIIVRDGRDIGVLRYHLRRATADALIDLVAAPAEESRRGAGMAAAALAEGELRAAGASRVFAPAPQAHGIAVYFWIRLGYRPLMHPEWPCDRQGVAWLVRDL